MIRSPPLLRLLALFVPLTAWAADTIGVLPAAPGGPGPQLVDLSGQLRQALSAKGPGVLDAQQLRDRMIGPGANVSLPEADRSYEAARAAELAGDPERAIAGLRATLEILAGLPDGEETFRQWTRAVLRLAKLESEVEGREAEVRALLERLVRADPAVQVDPALYPPGFVALLEAVRKEVAALPRRELRVSSPSKGVRVFVDGRDVGAAPVAVTVAAGRYRVSGWRDPLRAPSRQVDLSRGDQGVVLDFAIAEALRPEAPGLALQPADRSGAFSVGGFLRLDAVVLVTLLQEGGGTFLVASLDEIRSGKVKASGIIRIQDGMVAPGGMSALADLLVTGDANRSPLVAQYDPLKPLPRPPPLLPPAAAPKASTALGWTSFATGVAALGLAGVSVWQSVESSKSYDAARQLDTLSPDYAAQFAHLTADGDAHKRSATILGVSAGACALTSVVLGYIAYRQTGVVGPFRF